MLPQTTIVLTFEKPENQFHFIRCPLRDKLSQIQSLANQALHQRRMIHLAEVHLSIDEQRWAKSCYFYNKWNPGRAVLVIPLRRCRFEWLHLQDLRSLSAGYRQRQAVSSLVVNWSRQKFSNLLYRPFF